MPMAERGVLGVRALGLIGTVRGNITCPKAGSEWSLDQTTFVSDGPSSDEIRMRQLGLGLSGSLSLGRWSPYLEGTASYVDAEFRVVADDTAEGGDPIVDRARLGHEGGLLTFERGVASQVDDRL